MVALYTTVGITFIIAQIFAWLRYIGKEQISFIFKTLASLGFLTIAIIGQKYSNTSSYFNIVMIALSLGFLGDVFLGLKNIVPGKKNFLVSIGIMVFLLGHFAYSINFLYHTGIPWWIFGINLGFAILLMFGTKILKYKLSFAYTVVSCLYAFTISLMMTSAIYFASFRLDNIGGILVLVGSILFFLSDTLLSASYFKSDIRYKKKVNYIVHQTYYPAQILMAMSIAFI